MNRRAAVLLLAAAAACGALAAGPAMAAGAPSPAGHWANAQKLAGLGKLNTHDAQVTAVSCATPGNCAAGGNYEDAAKQVHAFVAGEKNGRWGKAIQVAVPGSAVTSQIDSVSCGSPANCEAAGSFTDSGSHRHVFVVAEVNGSWGMASEVPGVATLTGSEMFSDFGLVSCASAGNCALGGSYLTAPGFGYVFVADERNGVWGTAQQAPGITDLHKTAFASINSVSCASPGNCAAAGRYFDASLKGQAFVVDEKAGTWGRAQPVPEMSMLKAVSSTAESVSCASAGNCTVAGHYTDDHNKTQAFIADETGGTWGSPQQVPGTGALNVSGIADVTSVSCGAPGNCATIGFYTDSKGSPPRVRGRREERHLAGGTHAGRGGRAELLRDRSGVLRDGGQLRRHRDRHYRIRPAGDRARGRRPRGQRRLGQGPRAPRQRRPQPWRGRGGPLRVVRVARQLRGRRVVHRQGRQ